MTAALEIRLFGEIEVLRDGAPVALPQSRKSRALLAYLALKAAPQRRDSLCEVLWELPDDPRAALRWSLSKLRPVVNDPDVERLVADRERAGFEPHGALVDVRQLEQACIAGLDALPLERLEALAALVRGPLLDGLDLPGQPAFESWRLAQQENARRLHVRVLDALARKLEGRPADQAEWLRRHVDIDPSSEDAHNHLIAALAASGARHEAERQVEISRRVLKDYGAFDEVRLRHSAEGERRPEPGRMAAARPGRLHDHDDGLSRRRQRHPHRRDRHGYRGRS